MNDNNIRIFRTNQKVELVIEVMESGADFTERIEVDVTKESGYLFVQTDRPIYRYSLQCLFLHNSMSAISRFEFYMRKRYIVCQKALRRMFKRKFNENPIVFDDPRNKFICA